MLGFIAGDLLQAGLAHTKALYPLEVARLRLLHRPSWAQSCHSALVPGASIGHELTDPPVAAHEAALGQHQLPELHLPGAEHTSAA